tara:strand:+ start:2574 stop:3761 length:1188 start_codon:yes stop_codon:yes gene_type:complete
MTVRANKPAFNIREKLKELTHSIGLKGRELMGAATVQEARDLVSAGRRNLLINGAMTVDQRNNGSAMTATTAAEYCLDRWRTVSSTSNAFSVQRVNRADVTPPEGFSHSMKITSSAITSVGASDYYVIQQRIEGNTLPGFCNSQTPITISFWVRSSLTGKYGGAWTNVGYTQYYPFQFNINNANTWEYKTITVPGSGNNYIDGNSQSAVLMISLGAGSDYSEPVSGGWTLQTAFTADDSTNFVDNTGDTKTMYLTGVQAEVGKNATEFEHRFYGEELALCQRYYQRNKVDSGNYTAFISGTAYSAGTFYGTYYLQTPMRTSPTSMNYSSLSDFRIIQSTSINIAPSSMLINNGSGTQTVRIEATTPGNTGLSALGGAWIQANNTTSAWIDFSAEL